MVGNDSKLHSVMDRDDIPLVMIFNTSSVSKVLADFFGLGKVSDMKVDSYICWAIMVDKMPKREEIVTGRNIVATIAEYADLYASVKYKP